MKLGFFTDTHARTDTPEGRTDDFRQSILQKLEEMGGIWKDHGVDVVLFGGDLFHTPDPAMSIQYDVMHILKSWGKRIIGVVGSHDYFGYQMKSLKRTALGLFYKSDLIELVDGEGLPDHIFLEEGVVITATHHTHWLSEDAGNYSKERVAGANYQIQLVHGDLVAKPVPWTHITIDQVNTASDLVLSGHVHSGWDEPITLKSTTFFNPGSIGRLENTGVERTPRVVTISSEEQTMGCILLSKLETHPFKGKKVNQEASSAYDITKLMQLIATTKVDSIDVKLQLPTLADRLDLGEEVLDKAFEFIEKADRE